MYDCELAFIHNAWTHTYIMHALILSYIPSTGTTAPVKPVEFSHSDSRKKPRPSGNSDANLSDPKVKKKKQFTTPRSRVHQKSAEKSHTYSHGRNGR